MLARMQAIEDRMTQIAMRVESLENKWREKQQTDVAPQSLPKSIVNAPERRTPIQRNQPGVLYVNFPLGGPELHNNFIKLFKRRGGGKWKLTENAEEASAALYVVYISGGGRVDLTSTINAVKRNPIDNTVVVGLVAGQDTVVLPQNLAPLVTSVPLANDWEMNWVSERTEPQGPREKALTRVVDSIIKQLANPQKANTPSWMQCSICDADTMNVCGKCETTPYCSS